MLHLVSLQSSLSMTSTVIPNDIELPIPGDLNLLYFLIVFSFLLHIIFVNITIAGSVFAVVNELRGMLTKNRVYDLLAYQLATQTSILKSIAVVLGVAPLLLISVLYTQFFYPSTILIGKAWLSIIIILIVAFLLLYVYKFSWESLKDRKGMHLSFGVLGSLLLLFTPLIFIVNVVSMLYPEMWSGAKGFFHSLFYYPQIWQRYAHFMLSSFAVAGMFMYWWNNRKLKQQGDAHQAVYQEGKSFGITIAFWSTTLQIIAGTLVLFSLDKHVKLLYMGGDLFLTALLLLSIIVSVVLIYFLYLLMRYDSRKWLIMSLATFVMVIGLMGWMRHEVRDSYVKPHQLDNSPTVQQEQMKLTTQQ